MAQFTTIVKAPLENVWRHLIFKIENPENFVPGISDVFILEKNDWAGIRFINSAKNFERALESNFEVKQPLDFGLMAACCLVSKRAWEQIKFDESLPFSEDKEWSDRVTERGFKIYDFNETFFYEIKRNQASQLNRIKNETLAHFQLHKELKFPNKIKLIFLFFAALSPSSRFQIV